VSPKRSNRSSGTDDSVAGEREILMAILALMVDDREAQLVAMPGRRRTELVLADAGIQAPAIATLLNKQVATVRMALYRAGKKGTSVSEAPSNA
jgi:DNA-directed RNA polymerase specialized sigma24 family protein